MKRVLLFDIDNGTLEELNCVEAELKKLRKSLIHSNEKAYEEFIAKAVKWYKEIDISIYKSLKVAYQECEAEAWILLRKPLALCPYCSHKDVNTLKYYNIFNTSMIICEKCGSPSFKTVFTKVALEKASKLVKKAAK